MKTRNTPGLFLRTAVALALAAGVGAAHADATLDKIKERGTVTIGVLANGCLLYTSDAADE